MSGITGMTCAWCNKDIMSGDLIVKNPWEHEEWLETFLKNWLPIKRASDDITSIIMEFIYDIRDGLTYFRRCHKICLDFTKHTTRSGRNTKMIRRLKDEEYVPGSGIGWL
jgi:hypothetical protein